MTTGRCAAPVGAVKIQLPIKADVASHRVSASLAAKRPAISRHEGGRSGGLPTPESRTCAHGRCVRSPRGRGSALKGSRGQRANGKPAGQRVAGCASKRQAPPPWDLREITKICSRNRGDTDHGVAPLVCLRGCTFWETACFTGKQVMLLVYVRSLRWPASGPRSPPRCRHRSRFRRVLPSEQPSSRGWC